MLDKGSNMVSHNIAKYYRKREIEHKICAPYNLSSNSHSELGVKKSKYALCHIALMGQSTVHSNIDSDIVSDIL